MDMFLAEDTESQRRVLYADSLRKAIEQESDLLRGADATPTCLLALPDELEPQEGEFDVLEQVLQQVHEEASAAARLDQYRAILGDARARAELTLVGRERGTPQHGFSQAES